LEDSYFRNNADLGTGLLMANLAITSPHFFALRACIATPFPAFTQPLLQFPHPNDYACLRFLCPVKD
jgi:hypothetical protein